jgi:hypothetical protein
MKSAWLSAMAAVFLLAGGALAQPPGLPPAYIRATPDPYLTDPLAPAAAPADVHTAAPAGDWWRWMEGCANEWALPYRVWASGDFLVWQIRRGSLPALTQTVPVGVITARGSITTISNSAGTTTTSTTLVPPPPIPPTLLPVSVQSVSNLNTDGSLNFSEQLGGRFAAGVWLDSEQTFGLECAGFWLNRETLGFNSTTTGTSPSQGIFTLPVSNTFIVTTSTAVVSTTSQSAFTQTLPLAIVRQASDTLLGTATTEMWGGEVNVRCASSCLGAVSGLVGFRYVNFQEALNVRNSAELSQTAQFPDGGVTSFPSDLIFTSVDSIRTRNQFYGAQVGLDLDMYCGRFFIDLSAKTGVGVMHESVSVTAISTVPNVDHPVAGGLFSSPFDQGTHNRNRIAFVPELNVKVGYQICPCVRAYLGYDFLWLSTVLRPGEQTGISASGIQATIAGSTSAITVNQPTFRYQDSNVWVNGINFGVEFRY